MHHRTSAEKARHLVIEIPHVRATVLRAFALLLETVVVPTLLLMTLLHYVGLVAALGGVLGWSAFVIGIRRMLRMDVPHTLWLCTGMLVSKAAIALATSSAVVYVLQPALGSVLMFLVFVGSAAIGKPVTERLARDFVHLPKEVFTNRTVKQVFVTVALVWGGSRLVDAGITLGFLQWGVEAGLFSRGVFSGLLTVLTIAICAGHGWRKLRGLPDVTLRFLPRPAPVVSA